MNAPTFAHISALRAQLWEAGYRPVALHTGDKRPFGNAWQDRARQEPAEAATAAPRADAANTGILCDGLRAVDIDIDDADTAAAVEALAVRHLGATLVRWRDNSPRVLLLYRAAEGEPVKRVLAGTLGKVEVLGRGQQLHSHGLHPSGAVLQWRPYAPEAVPLAELPSVTETVLAGFLEAAAAVVGAEAPKQADSTVKPPPGPVEAHAAHAEVAEVLARIPNAGPVDWETFNLVGLAIWSARGGADDGLALFKVWAAQQPAYSEAETVGRWHHYATSPPLRAGIGTLRRLAGEAVAGEPQRPLYRPLPPPAPFPLMALGPLRKAAEAIHVMTQAPEAMCGQSVLAVASLAAQPHVNVVLPYGSPRPLTCYFITIAESGERKSGVDRLATKPVLDKEHALRQLAEGERSSYAAEKCAWEAARDAAKKKAKSGDGAGKAAAFEAIKALGSEPRPPASPMLLAADPTPEGLTRHLGEGRPWAGVFTAEGGTLLGGHGFSDDARMRTGALFNSLWDGDPIRRLRQLTGQAFLTGRRCAMHVMVQPAAADKLLADPMLEGLGLLARMLFAAPTSTAGSRMHREPDYAAQLAHGDYCQRIGYLLDLPPPMDGDGLAPRPMALDDDARVLFIAFANRVEAQLAEGGRYRTIRGFGAKLAEHAARLAAVLAFYEQGGLGGEPEVQESHMASGIALAEYYAGEMLRLLGCAQIGAELQTAQAVLTWLRGQGRKAYHLAEVYQGGPSSVRTAEPARAAMARLTDHGYLRRLKDGAEVDGKPRREAWELLPPD